MAVKVGVRLYLWEEKQPSDRENNGKKKKKKKIKKGEPSLLSKQPYHLQKEASLRRKGSST
jgi:hypothetical protein